jgi:DNA-binding MarR family transcriptional regulator
MSEQTNIAEGLDDPLRHRVGYVVRRFNQAIRSQVEDGLRPLGLTASQYALLTVLERNSGVSNAQLARLLFVTPQTMTRMVAGLIDAGLVVRDVSTHHSRVMLARLTGPGQELVTRAHPVVDAAEDRLFAPLTEDQRALLLEHMWTCADACPGDAVLDGF